MGGGLEEQQHLLRDPVHPEGGGSNCFSKQECGQVREACVRSLDEDCVETWTPGDQPPVPVVHCPAAAVRQCP